MALPKNALELLVEQGVPESKGKNGNGDGQLDKRKLSMADQYFGLLSLRVFTLSLAAEIDRLEAERLRKFNLHLAVQEYEEALIRCALEKTGGCQRSAARLLDVRPSTLNAKIKRYQIDWKILSSNGDRNDVEAKLED